MFKNPKSVEKAMGLSALDPKVLSTEEKPIVTGMKSKFKKLNLPFWDDYEPFTVYIRIMYNGNVQICS